MVKCSKALAVTFCLVGIVAAMFDIGWTKNYDADDSAFANAQIGYAPSVTSDNTKDTTLRYLELTWREVEPEEGVYAWDAIEEKYSLADLREQGIHLVLRFICDNPTNHEQQMDIPDWLYNKTGDGSWYDTSYGKGYSPDYSNAAFIAAHHKVIAALAEHFDDGFVTYVELGSLGHWGEWHIKSDDGLVPMPSEAIRNQYAQDYIDAFSNAKLLMRRPFNVTASNKLGLYNDMTGNVKDTQEWLGWTQSGGWYGDEPSALSAMPDFWKNAPVGGEFESNQSMEDMLDTNLDTTIRLIDESHMSFIGPKIADSKYKSGYKRVLRHLGYKLRITSMNIAVATNGVAVTLTLANDGAAPFYWDWDANLYVETSSGDTNQTIKLPFDLPSLMPGESQTVEVQVSDISILDLVLKSKQLTFGIVDPMTGKDAVRLAINADRRNGRTVLI